MEYKQIQELVKMINKSNISELSIKDGEFEITIKQESGLTGTPVMYAQPAMAAPQAAPVMQAPAPATASAPAATPAPAANNDKLHTIKSPMIGTFYRSPSPDKPPFVNVGDEIKPGMPLCIVEAMKLFNEIESEVSGKVVKVLIDEASPIEYDQPMFIVELN
ncbi:MAG TPA: acetyl-CoA carboxylase biotin carboxyl carrier protein [Chitinophagaceae bacterium]|nr:acetyl-CoA carboxylase biotin carboxyl carrier protein [Chitinophagaceae bacterium]